MNQSPVSASHLPVAIVGGGPVGMSLALALHKQGIAAEIFDARERGAGLNDRRILALSHGTQQTLEWLGAWKGIDATAIRTIHISHRGRLGRTLIRATEEQVPALGHVASMHELYKTLDKAITAAGIPYRDNTPVADVIPSRHGVQFKAGHDALHARLVAYAEGRIDPEAEDTASRDYRQHALTAIVTAKVSQPNTAWERFTEAGPVALLPFGHAFALVQTCTPEEASALAALSATDFLAQLQARFGTRVSFTGTGPRHTFPLGLRYRRTAVAERQVWLGNAAQTLHPVAGQGFNLALRDVRELARSLGSVPDTTGDPGIASALQHYARRRRVDRQGTIGFTDTLVRLFSNDNPLLGHARSAGLLSLDLLPPARHFVARRMIYGARAW